MRTARSTVWTTALLLAVAACSRPTTPAHAPSGARPTPASTPASPNPTATPTASPSPAPPVTTPAPGARRTGIAPKIVKRVPRVSPNAAPQILAIAVSQTTVAPGDRVSGSVVTSSNVASVEARIGGYAMSLSKVGVGRFTLTYTVGPLPWFVRGNFTMHVIARNTRGDAATREIPFTVR